MVWLNDKLSSVIMSYRLHRPEIIELCISLYAHKIKQTDICHTMATVHIYIHTVSKFSQSVSTTASYSLHTAYFATSDEKRAVDRQYRLRARDYVL